MPKSYKKRRTIRRPQRPQNIIKTFHIICEGENTEPDYFNAFELNNALVKSFGKGEQRKKLVESTVKYIKENRIKIDKTEEVWVVFDFDIIEADAPRIRQDFNNAVELADKHKIKCATSNDSFELWYVLHFLYTDAQHRREWYSEKLSAELNIRYSKDKKVSKEMYQLLKDKQETAIKNAKKLELMHSNERPCDKNPHSSVYELVMNLNEYIQ